MSELNDFNEALRRSANTTRMLARRNNNNNKDDDDDQQQEDHHHYHNDGPSPPPPQPPSTYKSMPTKTRLPPPTLSRGGGKRPPPPSAAATSSSASTAAQGHEHDTSVFNLPPPKINGGYNVFKGKIVRMISDPKIRPFGFIKPDEESAAKIRQQFPDFTKKELSFSLDTVCKNKHNNEEEKSSFRAGASVEFKNLKQFKNGVSPQSVTVVLHHSSPSALEAKYKGRFIDWNEKGFGFIKIDPAHQRELSIHADIFCHEQTIVNLNAADNRERVQGCRRQPVDVEILSEITENAKKKGSFQVSSVRIVVQSAQEKAEEKLSRRQLDLLSDDLQSLTQRWDEEDIVRILSAAETTSTTSTTNKKKIKADLTLGINSLLHHSEDLLPGLLMFFLTDVFWPPAHKNIPVDIPDHVENELYELFKKFMVNAAPHFDIELVDYVLPLLASFKVKFGAVETCKLFPDHFWKDLFKHVLNKSETALTDSFRESLESSRLIRVNLGGDARIRAIQGTLTDVAARVGSQKHANPSEQIIPNNNLKNIMLGAATAANNEENDQFVTTLGAASVEIIPSEDFDPTRDYKANLRKLVDRPVSYECHLDTLFHLYREDAVYPLRKAVVALHKNPNMPREQRRELRLKAYHDTTFAGINVNSTIGSSFLMKFRANKNMKWNSSKRLMPGALVLLTEDNFQSIDKILVGVVAVGSDRDKDRENLKNGEVHIKFLLEDRLNLHAALTSKKKYLMIESSVYWEASVHVLHAIKRLADNVDHALPDVIQRALLAPRRGFDNPPPPRASRIPSWDSLPQFYRNQFTLDATQEAAVRHILSSSVAVVCGVPGSGKSYTGVAVARILLDSWNNKIPATPQLDDDSEHDDDGHQQLPRAPHGRIVDDGTTEVRQLADRRGMNDDHDDRHVRPNAAAAARAQQNVDGPNKILVVTYTNHALDDFLMDLAEKRPDLLEHRRLLRLGGGCRDEEFGKKVSLRGHYKLPFYQLRDARDCFQEALSKYKGSVLTVDEKNCPEPSLRREVEGINECAREQKKIASSEFYDELSNFIANLAWDGYYAMNEINANQSASYFANNNRNNNLTGWWSNSNNLQNRAPPFSDDPDVLNFVYPSDSTSQEDNYAPMTAKLMKVIEEKLVWTPVMANQRSLLDQCFIQGIMSNLDQVSKTFSLVRTYSNGKYFYYSQQCLPDVEKALKPFHVALLAAQNPLQAWVNGDVCPLSRNDRKKHHRLNKQRGGENNNNAEENADDAEDDDDNNIFDQWAEGNDEIDALGDQVEVIRFDDDDDEDDDADADEAGVINDDDDDSDHEGEGERVVAQRARDFRQIQYHSNKARAAMELLQRDYGSNLQKFPLEARAKFCSIVRKLQQITSLPNLRDARDKYNRLIEQFQSLSRDAEFELLRDHAQVIGATTTGLAKNIRMISRLRNIKVVLVEEAAEISEAQLLSAIPSQCCHLIQIGDYQQLRPKCNVTERGFDLADEYRLGISFMERLIITNTVRHVTLINQRRMRPEISHFIRPFYEAVGLEDDPCVSSPERSPDDIEGMNGFIQFINHDEPELKSEETMSTKNENEARFVAFLAVHIRSQEQYLPSYKNIVIIAPYVAQVLAINRYLADLVGKNVSRKELPRVTSIDDYQGEEADVVILSLTRSESPGFLSIENRIIVGMSRARKGLFVVGNLECFREKSRVWERILAEASRLKYCVPSAQLKCSTHQKLMKIKPSHTITDMNKIVGTLGGCNEKCGLHRECGHVCESQCHGGPCERFECYKPCNKIAEGCRAPAGEKHHCTLNCYSPTCSVCRVPVTKKFACPLKHEVKDVECRIDEDDPENCPVLVSRTHPHCQNRAHLLEMTCGEWFAYDNNNTEGKAAQLPDCQHLCGGMHRDCSHKCERKCCDCLHIMLPPEEEKKRRTMQQQQSSAAASNGSVYNPRIHGNHRGGARSQLTTIHSPCQHACGRKLNTCSHTCTEPCSDICPPCSQKCETQCDHGLPCNKPCSQPCISCAEPCKNSCPHKKCSMLCGEVCDRDRCDERCKKILPCKHRCYGLCGEECPDVCLECNRYGEHANSLEDLFPFLCDSEKENPLFYTLPCCGRILEYEEMDSHISARNQKSQETGELLAPNCPFRECNNPLPIKGARRYKKEIMKVHNMLQASVKPMVLQQENEVSISFDKACNDLTDLETNVLPKWNVKSPCIDSFRRAVKGLRDFHRVQFCIQPTTRGGNRKSDPRNNQHQPPPVQETQTHQKKLQNNLRAKLDFASKVRLLRIISDLILNALAAAPSQTENTLREELLPQDARRTLLTCLDETSSSSSSEAFSELLRELLSIPNPSTKTNTDRCDQLLLTIVLNSLTSMCLSSPHKGLCQQSLADSILTELADSSSSSSSSSSSKSVQQQFELYGALMEKFLTFDEKERREKLLKVAFDAINATERGSLSSGHVYFCPNGHPYIIGDCGGAMQVSKCPDCGAKIGGTQHRLLESNKAGGLDGHSAPAWPQGPRGM